MHAFEPVMCQTGAESAAHTAAQSAPSSRAERGRQWRTGTAFDAPVRPALCPVRRLTSARADRNRRLPPGADSPIHLRV